MSPRLLACADLLLAWPLQLSLNRCRHQNSCHPCHNEDASNSSQTERHAPAISLAARQSCAQMRVTSLWDALFHPTKQTKTLWLRQIRNVFHYCRNLISRNLVNGSAHGSRVNNIVTFIFGWNCCKKYKRSQYFIMRVIVSKRLYLSKYWKNKWNHMRQRVKPESYDQGLNYTFTEH